MINQSNKLLSITAILIFLVSGYYGYKSYQLLTSKAASQTEVTDSIHRWKQNYLALGETVKRWDNSYKKQESVPDLMTLITLVRLGDYNLSADVNTLFVNRVEQTSVNSTEIGLTKVCLATSAGAAFGVQSGTYQSLLAGIKELTKRPDISMDTITVKGNKNIPAADLGEFCVLLSN